MRTARAAAASGRDRIPERQRDARRVAVFVRLDHAFQVGVLFATKRTQLIETPHFEMEFADVLIGAQMIGIEGECARIRRVRFFKTAELAQAET